MISKELAKYLLIHYREVLVKLGRLIDADKARGMDDQNGIISYIIDALEQISGEQQTVSTNAPQTRLFEKLQKEAQRYKQNLKDDELDLLNDFSNYILQKPLVFFKDYNGNLRINFPSRAWCEAFKKELGAVHVPVDLSPLVWVYCNKQLCFKGNKDPSGQLRISFPNMELRENFLMLLRHVPQTPSINPELPKPKMTLVDKDPLAVYFTPDFYIEKFTLKVLAPADISLHEDSVRMDMLYATRMVAQGIRSDESRFKFFPTDTTKQIISHATGGRSIHIDLPVDDSQFLNVIANHL